MVLQFLVVAIRLYLQGWFQHQILQILYLSDKKNGHFTTDILGKGGFGIVRKATYMGQEVAVKYLKFQAKKMDPLMAIELFAAEAEKMRDTKL